MKIFIKLNRQIPNLEATLEQLAQTFGVEKLGATYPSTYPCGTPRSREQLYYAEVDGIDAVQAEALAEKARSNPDVSRVHIPAVRRTQAGTEAS